MYAPLLVPPVNFDPLIGCLHPVIKNITNVGTICGCDWSGYVAQVGKNVSNPSVGDHVAGFVQGGTYTDRGAYAEYVKTPAELVWKVPDQTLSHEEAATMGCS